MLEYETLDLDPRMAVRVVIKLGGGLISDKSSMKSFNSEAVEKVVEALLPVSELGVPIILVHGAGSFGHPLAKKWNIADGKNDEKLYGQRDAVEEIRSDMKELNELIINKFSERGLMCISHPPSAWAIGTGARFLGDVSVFESSPLEPIPVTFGDVVETDDEKEFGILSGDDLMLRLCIELDVTHCIFLIGDADGVLTGPPSDKNSELITHFRSDSQLEGVHNADIDVTGGIGLKIERSLEIAKEVDEVWILDGRRPERILELLASGKTKGTKFLHG
jgi:isopentenyl phosphate kinase